MLVPSLSGTVKRALFAGGTLVAAAATVVALSGAIATAAPPASSNSAAVPLPVPVTVNAGTTAYLVLDLTTAVCAPNPACVATLPAVADSLAQARAAGALVVYSKTVTPGDQVMPQVAPLPTDPVVMAKADKFLNTDLAQILSSHGIKTVVIVGTKSNGAVMYTAYEANARGYTAVVAEDGISADTPFISRYSLFQLLNAPGFPNATNAPLAANAVTLSKTTMITFAG